MMATLIPDLVRRSGQRRTGLARSYNNGIVCGDPGGVEIVDAEDQVAHRVSLSQCLAGDDRGFPSWMASPARRGSVSRDVGVQPPA